MRLVLVTGLPATGKSTMADVAGRALGAPVLAHDWAMSGLRPYPEIQTALDDMGPRGHRDVGWSMVWALARAQLRAGRSVVLDGVAREPEIAATRSLARQEGAASLVVMTRCPDAAVHRSLVEGRERGIPNWYELDWAHVERSRAAWVEPTGTDVVLEATDGVSDNARRLATLLPTPGGSAHPRPVFLAVNGPPGSGKTTLACDLSDALGLPLLAKDAIKEALMTVVEIPDVDTSRQMGRAAIAAMLRTASTCPTGAVLDANFHRTLAVVELQRLPGEVIEIFCVCPRSVCSARYRERAPHRSPGHFDSARSGDEIWNDDVARPVAGGWPVLEVPTAEPVELGPLVAALEPLIASRSSTAEGPRSSA